LGGTEQREADAKLLIATITHAADRLRHYWSRTFDRPDAETSGEETLRAAHGQWTRHPRHQYAGSQCIDILRIFARATPYSVLVMSGFSEKTYAINVLRAGRSVIRKDRRRGFMRAVHTVLAGVVRKRHMSEMLVSALDEPDRSPLHAALSQREFQIRASCRGTQRLGDSPGLFISVKTVSTYRARVLGK